MAARKKVDPLKAKAAKQKKIAIAGTVLLCLLIAVQGPKTMKMLQGPPQAAPTAAPAPTATPATGAPVATPGTGAPVTPVTGTPVPGAAEPGAGADLALVADSDAAPAPAEGQLVTFERFASKDPFAPQAVATSAGGGAAPAAATAEEGSAGGVAPGAGSSGGGGSDPVDGGFTPAPPGGGSSSGSGSGAPAPAAPAAPAAPSVAAVTSISINGTAEDVQVDATFPAAEPTFVLVSQARDGKSVEIGVAGGSYANGEQTITLELGEPLTLQNTADGSRYELELLAVAGFASPKR